MKCGGQSLIQSDDKVIYLGFFFRHWGHFLIDHLARACFLYNEEYRDCKVVSLSINGSDLCGNYARLFELMGFSKENVINVSMPTQFREVFIPKEAKWR